MWVVTEIALIIVAGCLAWPMVLISIEIFGALFYTPIKSTPISALPNTVILIPAHNEELDIADTINCLTPQLTANRRLLVVADNCSDKTVEIAQKTSAEVIVRTDINNLGKGFALDFGIQHLRSNPPEIVIIIDADCKASSESIDILAHSVRKSGKPNQARYIIHPRENCSVGQQISAFAVILKNHIRLLGLKKLGIPCHLTGSGMAFPWDTIEQAKLASGNIVEDMKLGVDMIVAGHGTQYCPEAYVHSKFPETQEGHQEQRTRWEHGHLQTILSLAPGLLWECFRKRKWRELVFALDLAIPPLSLVFFIAIAGLIFTGTTAFIGLGLLAFKLLFGVCTIFFIGVIMAWWKFGRKTVPIKSLLGVPGYIFSKLTLYRRFIRHRQKDWVRTERR